MELNCTHFINKHIPEFWDKNILVACSGGVDSMVLAHFLLQKKVKISLAHVNFKLRKHESDLDEECVKDFAHNNNIPFFSISYDTQKESQNLKLSLQETARKLRYDWFAQLIQLYGFDIVTTAHHLDDQMETFLFHTFRGTGLKGLTGIPVYRSPFFRPLLNISKAEILEYAHFWNVHWREDQSNKKNIYTRNALRHLVITPLKSVVSNPEQGFLTTLHHLKNALDFYENALHEKLKTLVVTKGKNQHINTLELNSLAFKNDLLYHWLSPFGFKAWPDIYNLVNAETGKFILSETHRLYKNRDELVLERRKSEEFNTICFEKIEDLLAHNQLLRSEIVNALELTTRNTIFVNPTELRFPLFLRKWKQGDWFIPKGMHGKKKISRFFIDQKFSLTEKGECLLLSDSKSIIWVVGHRMDERFVVKDNKTSPLLKISYLE